MLAIVLITTRSSLRHERRSEPAITDNPMWGNLVHEVPAYLDNLSLEARVGICVTERQFVFNGSGGSTELNHHPYP